MGGPNLQPWGDVNACVFVENLGIAIVLENHLQFRIDECS